MNGLHLIADLYQCNGDQSLLLDRPVLEELCVNECRRVGLTPLGSYFYQFEYDNGQPAGVTGTVVLAESHLAIHTWPESGDVTLDVYVCNFSRDNGDLAESLLTSLIQALKPESLARHQVVRGGRDAQGKILPSSNAAALPKNTLYEPLNTESGIYLQGATLLESGRSAWQDYDVWQTNQFGKVFRLDGFLMTSESDEFLYHENLVHVPALSHGAVRRALIIGGGDGGSAEEMFKLPQIEEVTLVELDETVISLARKYFDRVHHGALDDKRLNLQIANGLDYVAKAEEASFDLIVLDLTDPLGEAKPLYEAEFFRACKKLLRARGALSLHIGSPNFQPERVQAIMAALRSVFRHVEPYFVYIPLYGSLWGMACASDELVPRETPTAEIETRIGQLTGLPLQHYNGDIHHAQFALSNQLRALLAP